MEEFNVYTDYQSQQTQSNQQQTNSYFTNSTAYSSSNKCNKINKNKDDNDVNNLNDKDKLIIGSNGNNCSLGESPTSSKSSYYSDDYNDVTKLNLAAAAAVAYNNPSLMVLHQNIECFKQSFVGPLGMQQHQSQQHLQQQGIPSPFLSLPPPFLSILYIIKYFIS